MKKLFRILVALFMGTVMVFSVAGCNAGTQNELQGKVDDLQTEIAELSDRLAEMEDQIRKRDERIEKLEKQLSGELSEGPFYSLQTAYDNGWLTQEDLMSIAYYNNGGREYNEEIMPEDYAPQAKTPEILDEPTNLAIKQSVWEESFKEDNPHNITTNDIGVSYYGIYKNCVAVKTGCYKFPYLTVEGGEIVSGVYFYYSGYYSGYTGFNHIVIWKEKEL